MSRWKRAFSITVCVLLTATAAAVSLPAPSANAWYSYGCKWNHNTVTYSGSTLPATYSAQANNAASAWNGVTSPAKFSSSSSPDFRIYSGGYGSTGWSGYTSPTGSPGIDAWCSGGIWGTGAIAVYLNTSYLGSYAASEVKSVIAHEMGHVYGLAHNNATSNCAGGHYPSWLMYYSDYRFIGNGCGPIYGPKTDDANGVNALY